jgi:hypothetical protein
MVLQRLQEPGRGVALASTLGVSESTVSRLKNDQLEGVLALIYALGFKVVGQCKTCVATSEIKMLREFYARAVQDESLSEQLLGSDE